MPKRSSVSLVLVSLVSLVSLGMSVAFVGACDKKKQVVVVEEKEPATERGASERDLRKEYEARKKARENAPEPKLDPNSAREKLELIWDRGKKRLDTIYNERADLVDALAKRMKLLDKESMKALKPLFKPLYEFGMGKSKEELEKAPKELCDMIQMVRVPAEIAITKGEKQLRIVNTQLAELDKKQDAGGTVYQKQFDKLEDAKAKYTAPVLAGRQILLMVRNILEEAEVLAKWGARRSQLALGKCLTDPVAKSPLMLELAQETLERVIKRTKWYRDEPR